MEHDFGPVPCKNGFQGLSIPDIAPQIGLYLLPDARKHVIVPFAVRIQGQADHFRAQRMQPDAQPTTLESRMPGHQDPLSSVETLEIHKSYPFRHVPRDWKQTHILTPPGAASMPDKTWENHVPRHTPSYQIFQGALPSAHIASNSLFSRWVSIGRQKP